MGKYFKNNFYPQNFILLTTAENKYQSVDEIVNEAVLTAPEKFNGRRNSFPFELRYVPPFDKNFRELKRLQGTAAEMAGYHDEYRGYIVIDLSEYIKHELEVYFEIAVNFFHDMNEYWKFIFVVDNSNQKSALDLVSRVLFILDDVPCRVIELKQEERLTNMQYVEEICEKYKVTCSKEVQLFLQNLLEQKEYLQQIVSILVREIAGNFDTSCVVNMELVKEYMKNQDCVIKYMMNPKQFDKFMDILEKREEKQNYAKAV